MDENLERRRRLWRLREQFEDMESDHEKELWKRCIIKYAVRNDPPPS